MSEDESYLLAARLLRSAREQAGLTQAEFAARVGVPRSMVSAYERGVRQATVPTLQRMLTAVGYNVQLVMVPSSNQLRPAEPAASDEQDAARPDAGRPRSDGDDGPGTSNARGVQ